MANYALIKILTLTFLAFGLALALTPLWTNFLLRFRLGKQIRNDGSTPIFSQLHEQKAGTPTMGGVLIWGSALILISLFWFLDRKLGLNFFHKLNFLTRRETLLPLGAFLGASIVGLIDDFLDVRQMGHKGRGLRFRFKIWLYLFVAIVGAWWFYFKLDFTVVHIPFFRDIDLGFWFIPLFILIVTGTSFAVNQTDGLDGLAGGILLISFSSYGLIAYFQGRENLASLIGVVCGGLLAFLWFNVYPARFFMGDTGSMGMGVLLAIIAFLTKSAFLLPIIGFIFMIESASSFLQLLWRKFFKKKLFLTSPLHHHLEALGWPESKVTMRFWIISMVTGMLGVIIYFVG